MHSLDSEIQLQEKGWTLTYSGIAQGKRRWAGVGTHTSPGLNTQGWLPLSGCRRESFDLFMFMVGGPEEDLEVAERTVYFLWPGDASGYRTRIPEQAGKCFLPNQTTDKW